jgi:hypothetical protein
MDEKTKHRRAGIVVGLLGVLMLLLWIGVWAGVVPWSLSQSTRIFLLVIGAPLLLAGVLIGSGVGAKTPPPV